MGALPERLARKSNSGDGMRRDQGRLRMVEWIRFQRRGKEPWRLLLKNARGEGKAGCLIMVLILAVAVYLCVQVVPVYLNKLDFEEDLDRIASKAGSENWNDQLIRDRVREAARVRDFQLQEADVEIRRANPFDETPRFRIIVNYHKNVQLPGYLYRFEFQSESSSLVIRL